jgi:HSP20 family protein
MIQKIWDPFFDLTHPFSDVHGRDLRQAFGKLNAMDVTERENDVLVEVEVPGLKKENLDLVVKDDTLTVTGKVEESLLNEDEKVWTKEVMHKVIHV